MNVLPDLLSSRVRPIGVGPRPRGATVGDRPLAKVARPEGVAKATVPANKQSSSFLSFVKKQGTRAPETPKVGVADQDRIPDGDDENLRVRQVA